MSTTINSTVITKTVKLLVVSVIIVLSVSLSSTELTPAENINPSKAEPTLNNHPQEATLKLDDSMTQTTKDINVKSKPSWWKWLANSSKKPAYFHYIDIIELLE
jgi:hypothetical protein